MNSGLRLAARTIPAAALIACAAVLLNVKAALAAPVAVPPYTLTTFKGTPPSGATEPDDLAISADGADLWVGYGNNVSTTGTTPSNLVEYDISSGNVLQNLMIPGHLDGLKIDPTTGEVWATQNEDGNPRLAIVNPKNGKFKVFNGASNLITGGMDDLVFAGPNVFIVASSQMDTTTPVVVEVSGKMKKKTLELTAAVPGAPPTVWNVVANKPESGDMISDPDSMTLDPAGELVLDNRSDDSLYIIRSSGATNPILRVPLVLSTAPDVPLEVNDTIFTFSATTGKASTAGTIFITDTSANAIYLLTKPYFPSNEVYTAANVVNDVGLVDLNTGIVTPVATGFAGVHGLAFSPTSVGISSTKDK